MLQSVHLAGPLVAVLQSMAVIYNVDMSTAQPCAAKKLCFYFFAYPHHYHYHHHHHHHDHLERGCLHSERNLVEDQGLLEEWREWRVTGTWGVSVRSCLEGVRSAWSSKIVGSSSHGGNSDLSHSHGGVL